MDCGAREYYHSFTGEYGGLWLRQGRPPQRICGIGFTSQGFDRSSYYRRLPDSFNDRAAFIFAGVGDHERIGDFGLVGDGAAGFELDRADRALGTPPHALVLASSEGHSDTYLRVLEDLHVTGANITGTTSPLVRADMVFYETPDGGAVFSTGSIAWPVHCLTATTKTTSRGSSTTSSAVSWSTRPFKHRLSTAGRTGRGELRGLSPRSEAIGARPAAGRADGANSLNVG